MELYNNLTCLLNDESPESNNGACTADLQSYFYTNSASYRVEIPYIEGPKKKFKSQNFGQDYLMCEGTPDIYSALHKSIFNSEHLSTRFTSRCLFCQASKKACNSSPGDGKCERCVKKSGQGEEIYCIFDMNLYRKSTKG